MKIRKKALHWMANNMHVVRMFEEYGEELTSAGGSFGVNLLRERVRYEQVFAYGGEYKIPNDVSPYIGRYLLWKHPQWDRFMECRLAKDETDCIVLVTDADIERAAADEDSQANIQGCEQTEASRPQTANEVVDRGGADISL
jgi:hypothetical protein